MKRGEGERKRVLPSYKFYFLKGRFKCFPEYIYREGGVGKDGSFAGSDYTK